MQLLYGEVFLMSWPFFDLTLALPIGQSENTE